MASMRKIIVLLFLVIGVSAWADAPGIINYQGKLTDQNGNPITDNAGIEMVFSLYNVPTGGSNLFQETRTVPVDNGVFVVQIGSMSAGGISKSIFRTNSTLYLGVKVGADLEMLPRERLVSAPYALAIATGSVGQQEIIPSTITLSQVDISSFDTRYITSSPSTMTVTYSVYMATQSGRVGVGTLNPNYALHVATAAGTTSTLFAVSTGSVDLFRVTGTSVALKVPIFFADGTTLSSAGNYVLRSGDTMSGQLTVQSASVTFTHNAFSVGGSTLTVALGKVGIGTASPLYLVQFATAAGTSSTLFAVSTGSVDLFRVNGASVALKVPLYFPDGTAQVTAYTGSVSAHQASHMDGGSDRLTGSLTLTTATLTGSSFSVGGSTLVVKDGKVGVGTAGPNYILMVATAAGTTSTLFAVSTGPVDLFRVGGTSAALKVPLYLMDGTPLISASQFEPAGSYVETAGDTMTGQLTVQSSVTVTDSGFSVGGSTLATNLGKVGVGTASPSYQLQVTTAAGTTSTLFAVSTGPVDLFRVNGTSVVLQVPLYFPDGTVQVTAAETPANLDSTYVNEGQALSISAGMIVDGATLSEIADDDGAGSGLDADLLDGLSSAVFMRSNTSDSFTSGTMNFNTGTTLRMDGTADIDTDTDDVDVSTHVTVLGAIRLNGGTLTTENTIDFGAGAADDLTAADVIDLTDGGDTSLHTHTGLVPGAHESTHVDGGSDRLTGSLTLTTATLTGNRFSVGTSTFVVNEGKVGIGTASPSYQLQVTTAAGTTSTLFAVSTGPVDLFKVSGTSAALKVPLYFPDGTVQVTAAETSANLDSTYVNEGQALSISAGMIVDGATLSEISDDDGAGSGLDADLLDGLNSTAFADTSHQSTHVDGGSDRLTGSLTLTTATLTGSNFSVAGATFVVVHGDVGIGTTNPSFQLHVTTAAGTTSTLFAVSTGPVSLFRVSGASVALKVPLYFQDGTAQATAAQTTGLANPTASVGLTAVNGSAATAMRSDGAPALSQSIAPTWSGVHTWTSSATFRNNAFNVGTATFVVTGGKVGIGTTAPKTTIDIMGGFSIEMQSRSSGYTMNTGDYGVVANASGGGFTVTLPAASNNGMMIYIKKIDSSANVVTVSRAGSDTIEGSTSKALSSQYQYIHLVADGTTTWYIKSQTPLYEP